ncbi:glycosyltransferase family 4 protein [Pseudarthrobacter sp. NPDC092424]|uniref:glycosyltransferase family 4 protein n=1 Tax=Pseudarthrobacter sp. NPDC092424 TaxID=3364415 RepID=UPI00382B3E58
MTNNRPATVIVASRLFTPEVGAASFRLKALVDGLAEGSSEVCVLTTRPPKGSPAFTAPYRLSRWPVLRDAGGNVRGYLQYLSFDGPVFFRLLFSRADVVVAEPPPTTGVVAALTSVLRRRPFVYYAADIWTEALAATDVSPVIVKVMKVTEGLALRKAAKVLAISDAVADKVTAFGVPPERVALIGNGIDTGVFGPAGPVWRTDEPYFVYTGTMSEWQGADIFIRALPKVLEEHPTAAIHFFGQGSDESRLKELAAKVAPGRVHFGGVVPPAEAASRIRGAVGALVSIKPGQGYDFAKPTKIYAAAGCGTPVIFAGSGEGAAVVADNGLGETAEYDPSSVAAAMSKVLGRSAAGEDQGREARSRWVEENASLATCGRRAAAAVLSVLQS